MDLKCSQSIEVVGLKDVEISLKGSEIVEVMCADDATTGLKIFGTPDVVQINLFSRLTFVKGLEASFEFLLAT
jgi:hypothetical protein